MQKHSARRAGTLLALISCFLAVGIAVSCLAGCNDQNVGVSLAGPTYAWLPNRPAVSYTALARNGGDLELVYFLIIKPSADRNGGRQQSINYQASSNRSSGSARSRMTLNGSELSVEYNVTVRRDGSLGTESLLIGGQNQPLEKGRVLLVDLSTAPIAIIPNDVNLTTPVPVSAKTEDMKTFVESALVELERDPAIAEFVRPLK